MRRVLFTTTLILWTLPMAAQGPTWTFGGFGTAGVTQSSTDGAQYLRDLTQPLGVDRDPNVKIDSRLGLQANVALTDTLRATVQVVSKYRHDKTWTPDLTWALLAWSPMPDLQIRGGRLGFDVFMDSDSRDVGYSFLWTRPPVEYFGGLAISHFDGIDLARDFSLATGGSLRLKIYGGLASEKLPVGGTEPLDLSGSPLLGVMGEWTRGPWRSRLGYAQFRPRHNMPAPLTQLQDGLRQFAVIDPRLIQAADDLNFADRRVRYASAAVAFEQDGLQAQGALARFQTDAVTAPDSWSGFASLGYRVGKVVPFGAFSRISSSRPSVDLGLLPLVPSPEAQGLIQGLEIFLNASQSARSTWTFGMRWNLADKACLKVQVDRVQSHNASGLWARPQPGWDGRATLVTATLDFVF